MKSIRTKIMWALFSSVLISTFVIGLMGILLTSRVIEQSTTENMKLLCTTNAGKIDIALAKVEESVDTLAHFIGADLSDAALLKDDAYRATFSATVKNNALHHIESINGAAAIYLQYDSALIGKTDGFFYVRHEGEDAFQNHPLTDIPSTPTPDSAGAGWWYIPTIHGKATWFEAYYDAIIGRYVISYVVPIYIDDQLIGVIGADLSADYIEDLVKEVSVFNSGQAAVLKSDGTVLYHPNFERGELIGKGDPGFDGVIEQLTKENATSELISYKLETVEKKLASCKLRNGMLMICFAPVSEIYAQENVLIMTNLTITIVVILLVLLVADSATRKLVRPIKQLNEAAKHMRDGEFDFDVASGSKDEIGELTKTFIETRQTLRHQIYLLDTEAHRDGLTGVGNKAAFIDRESEINEKIASGNAHFFVAVFDVDKLKVANDVFGHMAGDKLLITVANHLSEVLGISNIFRIGGDEFVAIVSEESDVDTEAKIGACTSSLKRLTVEEYPDFKVSCALGISRFNEKTDHQLADVLHRADQEMYKNKMLTKKGTISWQEGAKGIKQLQIEKYCQLLQSLKDSTDDFLFLMNLETGYLRVFGDSTGEFIITDGHSFSSGMSDVLSFVHTNDHALVKKTLISILYRESTAVNIDFRIHQNDVMRWVNCRASVINEGTESRFLMIGRLSQNAIKHLYDPVTTLFNKTKLSLDLQRESVPPFSYLMLLDIDNLSEIDLKHGSSYGDKQMKLLAESLERRFSMWQIYHAEKDFFVVLLNVETNEDVERIFTEIQSSMAGKCTISATVVPNDKSLFISADNIYDYAVQTNMNAKQHGSGRLTFFSRKKILEKISTVELWEELEESVKRGCDGFFLAYQPQIRDEDYAMVSAEALLRFKSKTKGNIYPDQLIPVLEQTGLINEVGIWVLDEALGKCKQWRKSLPDFKISVNLSPKQLEAKQIVAHTKRLLAKYDLPGEALILEITESSQLDEDQEIYAVLSKLRNAGVQLAIDDFGTGYSNLGNLKHIHANILKIDRVFVQDIKENGYSYHLIRNVIEFAKANHLQVCLEGVETCSELFVLSGLNPDLFQGYLFEKPIPAEELEERYFQPESLAYAKRQQQIEQLREERKHAAVVNIETKAILQGIHIGLWIIRIDTKSETGELFADSKMKELLGVSDSITPKACYTHWWNNIQPAYASAVTAMVDEMKNTDEVIQVEYSWHHPEKGDIIVRCSGRCVERDNDVVTFEGFHRVISDLGKSF